MASSVISKGNWINIRLVNRLFNSINKDTYYLLMTSEDKTTFDSALEMIIKSMKENISNELF